MHSEHLKASEGTQSLTKDSHEASLISAAPQNEAALRQKSVEEYQQQLRIRDITLSSITDFAYIFDRAGKFLYANKPLLDLWGLTLAEAIGKNFFELKYPDDLAAKLQQQIQQVFDTKKSLADETPYISPSGVKGYYEYIFSPVIEADGSIKFVAGSTRDITKRKRTELNLAFLASVAQDLTRMTGVDEMMRTIGAKIGAYLNLSLCTFVEINEAEDEAVINHEWHRADVPGVMGKYRLAEFVTEDFQKKGRAGEVFIVRDTRTDPRTNAKGYDALKINSFVSVPLVRDDQWRFLLTIYHTEPYDWQEDEIELMRELTTRIWSQLERVRAESALTVSTVSSEKQRRLYDTILSNTPDFVYVFDLNYRFVYINDALLTMWGRTWENSIGKRFHELGYEPWHAAMHDREIDQVVATKKSIRGEVPFNGTHGLRIYDYIFAPVFDANGEVEAITGTTRDVTESKRTASALAQAKDDLEKANQNLEGKILERTSQLREKIGELEAFSYSISHDMRSPLRAMHGYAKTLLAEHAQNLNEEAQHYLERIHRASSRLDLLIQEVLTYSHLAKQDLILRPIDLERLVSDIRHTYPAFQPSEVEIMVKSPLPEVLGHEAFLTQIISNVLGNAVKFVKAGEKPLVTIRAEDAGAFARLWVEDEGIGIDPTHFKRIFEIFGRVYSETKYEGTGIGLAIAKKAVERMGGTIGVESAPGKGSRFWFELKKIG